MANENDITKGNGQNTPGPDASKTQWVSIEEADKYEKMIGKKFNRKVPKEKGEREKFFFVVEGATAYAYVGHLGNTDQHLVGLTVQKYYRNEFISKRTKEGSAADEQVNKPVTYAIIDRMGNGRIPDADARVDYDSREFEKQFERDNA